MSRDLRWTLSPLDAAVLPTEWQKLNERCCGSHPLLDPAFLNPLLREHAAWKVQLARLTTGGELLGLALVRRTGPGRWALFQPSQAPLGPIIVDLKRASAADAVAALLAALPRLPLELELTFLDPEFSPLPAAGPRTELIQYSTTMGVKTDGTFEEYWKARRKQLRYNLRNYRKRLLEAGMEWRLEVLTAPDDVVRGVDEYGDLESKGWKGEIGTAIHRDNSQGRIYREIMHAFAGRGDALVSRMLIGDRLIASWLIIVAGGMAVMLKTTFAEELAQYAVGRIVLYDTLEHLFSLPNVRVVEFYTKANAVQLQWSNVSRPIYHANAYRHEAVYASRRLLRAIARPFKRRKQSSPEPAEANA